MSEILLEPLNKCHIEGIIGIEVACFDVPWSEQSFLQELDNKNAHYLVALVDGEIAGYGGMWMVLDEAYITNIAVLPKFQKRGIATLMIQSLVTMADARAVLAMTLEVRVSNAVAIALYKKMGFEEFGIRKNYYENNNEDALIMWKHLG